MPRPATTQHAFYAQAPYGFDHPPPSPYSYGYPPSYGFGHPVSPSASTTGSWDQTALLQQFQTMGLQSPGYVMDTGASSHFASDPGMLTSVSSSPPSSRTVIVGNGSSLPIAATGHARFPLSPSSRPLYLRNVLVAPNIVKNLVPVRKFTTDNCVSVEFDPFGFSVKDLPTKTEILRSNSFGALYPVLPTTISHPQALLVADPALWHCRLAILDDLSWTP
jgi:hypothetical protein